MTNRFKMSNSPGYFSFLSVFTLFFCVTVGATWAQSVTLLANETGSQMWFDPYRGVLVLSNGSKTVSLDPQTRLAVSQDRVFELSVVEQTHNGIVLAPTDFSDLKNWLNGQEAPLTRKAPTPPPPGYHPILGVIVLDPGHGGKDPGCMSTQLIDGKKVTLEEKNLTLAVVLKLAKLLRARYPDKKIVLTRTSDTYPTLEDRVKIANSQKLTKNEGILFLSVHFNASIDKNARGVEFWYVPQDFQRDVLAQRAIPEIAGDAVPIMNAWLDSEYKKESFELARDLSHGVAKVLHTGDPDRGLKQMPFYVVRFTRMPAVLAELGFVTNPEDAALLVEPDYLKKLAQGLYNGIVSFVTDFEGGS